MDGVGRFGAVETVQRGMEMRHSIRYLTTMVALAALSGCGGATDLFDPDALQGIQGVALRGPICPVQSLEDPCPDQPHQAWVTVRAAATGGFVTRFRTGEDGMFRVGLKPGSYTLDPEGGDPFPAVSEQDVEVLEGIYTDVVISFDTGIR